ncbi:O-succinylbenzoate synthase [Corynebacterium aquilae DSM 44791]|uniref:O-succinylbenzoate synthase n=1 Tax=Corynebacterium aquilae DSM 44791 TaxID=1431546 RepID=A0A1L7CDQ5_9CORY|nr:O-succinylbenzoate synthase [Corynebacterium aquilae DSM 44791]
MATIDVDDILDRAYIVALPMRVRFRGITTREALVIDGPAGWGEFSPFVEYPPHEAAWWLASALEAAYLGLPAPARDTIPVNATIPAVDPDAIPAILDRYAGCNTIKIKVAEPGHSLDADIARVRAVKQLRPDAHIRIDANRGYSTHDAITVIERIAPLDYAEQPCATIDELRTVRNHLRAHHIAAPIAADEAIRKATDPLAVATADAVDAAVLKVAPLGGVGRTLNLCAHLPMRITIASALDTAIGITSGLIAASHLPATATGLATQQLFAEDIAEPRPIINGTISTAPITIDPDRLHALSAPADRQHWWRQHLTQSLQQLRLRLHS